MLLQAFQTSEMISLSDLQRLLSGMPPIVLKSAVASLLAPSHPVLRLVEEGKTLVLNKDFAVNIDPSLPVSALQTVYIQARGLPSLSSTSGDASSSGSPDGGADTQRNRAVRVAMERLQAATDAAVVRVMKRERSMSLHTCIVAIQRECLGLALTDSDILVRIAHLQRSGYLAINTASRTVTYETGSHEPAPSPHDTALLKSRGKEGFGRALKHKKLIHLSLSLSLPLSHLIPP